MEANPRRVRLTRQEAKAQTRQALLNAAFEVFSSHGFNGASVEMVAEAAGYTKGAVYAHFHTKEDLYLALLDEHLSEDTPDWIEQLEGGAPVAEIAAEIEAQLPEEIERTRAWAMMTLEFFLHAMRNEQVRTRLAERIERARAEYIRSLEKRYNTDRAGDAPMPLEHLATALMAFENGLSLLGLIHPKSLAAGIYSETLHRLLGE